METIYHQLAIAVPVERVYAAISTHAGIGTWWDKQTPVQTDQGLVLEHSPGPKHGVVKLKVLELVPNKRVEWECISSHPPESPASAWTGTHFVFEISERESAAATVERECGATGARDEHVTTVDFRQTNYDESSKFAGFNNFAWGQVLTNIKSVCESHGSYP
jgi:uncharacterized protein YndB with AHSA1/START domain